MVIFKITILDKKKGWMPGERFTFTKKATKNLIRKLKRDKCSFRLEAFQHFSYGVWGWTFVGESSFDEKDKTFLNVFCI